MKKVLFISTIPLYPVVSGAQIRSAQHLELLVSRYTVDVLYLSERKVADRTKEYLPAIRNVICFHVSKMRRYWQALRFLFNSWPLQVNYFYNRKVQQYVMSHIADYDMVFCNNIRTAEYVRELGRVTKCLDFVDAISMNYEKARNLAHGFWKWIYNIDYKRCVRYEQLCLSHFERCAVISKIDRQYILNHGNKH